MLGAKLVGWIPMRLTFRKYGFRQPRLFLAGVLMVLFGFVLVYSSLTHDDKIDKETRLVTIHDRGQQRTILTHASSVQDALNQAEVIVAPGDIVEPELTTELNATDSVVNIYRARSVIVVDGAVKQKVMTAAQTPEEIISTTDFAPIRATDKAKIVQSENIVTDGVSSILTIDRAEPLPPATVPLSNQPSPNALTKSKGAQMFTDSKGVVHRETYYDLLMNIVIGACGGGGYTVRSDGAKIDKDGYILVAANYNVYPRCSIVETSMGLGKVYDTGGFALRHPYGFDLATDWTNYDGR